MRIGCAGASLLSLVFPSTVFFAASEYRSHAGDCACEDEPPDVSRLVDLLYCALVPSSAPASSCWRRGFNHGASAERLARDRDTGRRSRCYAELATAIPVSGPR